MMMNASANNPQFFQMPLMTTNEFNAKSVLESDSFPDVLNYLSSDQIACVLDLLAQSSHQHLVNKPGPLGGYTALHWMAIKNELEMIEFLVRKCRADVNCRANLGETPLLICIK
jgi:hypothetical protein